MDLNNLNDHELDALLTEWGRQERARIQPDLLVAKEKFHPILMQRMNELAAHHQAAPSALWSAFSLLKNLIAVVRVPAGVMASLVLVVGLFGSMAYASQVSLPGDNLYPFKLQLEQAQIKLLPVGAARLEKKVAFSQRRLQEFLRLEQKYGTVDKMVAPTNVRQAIATYRTNIQDLTKELAGLRGQGNTQQLVAVAMRLDDTTAASLQSLKSGANNQALAGDLKKTRAVVQAASVRAIEVIAEAHDQAGLTVEQVTNRIQEKISATRAEVTSALADDLKRRPSGDVFSVIQQQLQAAEGHLAKRDFGNALVKLSSSQGLVDVAEDNKNNPVSVPAPTPSVKSVPASHKSIAKPANNQTQIEVWYSPSKPAYYFNEGDQRTAQ